MQFTDQLSRKIELKRTPQRIVSLVPSQTELLAYFGLDDQVVGITKFCVHPKNWWNSKVRVGGTKKIKMSRVLDLDPDLIIANKEENTPEIVEQLEDHCPVWVSDIQTVADSFEMITRLGDILNRGQQASSLISKTQSSFDQFEAMPDQPRTLYFIWREPYMAAGSSTFINDILGLAGFKNVANEVSDDNRYPTLDVDQLRIAAPEIILLSSEPYPFKEKHIEELKGILPQTKIILVDGELFSWYGPRLLKSAEYFQKLREELV